MANYQVTELPDDVVLREFDEYSAREQGASAECLARLAEVDARELFLPAGYSSMYAYLVGHLNACEDAVYRRIRLARVARAFPAIFPMLADARLNMSGVLLLGPHLGQDNADELLAAAANKSKTEIRSLLAERLAPPLPPTLLDPAAVDEQLAVQPVLAPCAEPAARPVLAPERVLVASKPEKATVQLTAWSETHDKLRYALSLLGHAIPPGNMAEVIDRAADALVREAEKQRFAAGVRTRPAEGKPSGRYIPGEVRRTVWLRDRGTCAFVGANGHRCGERERVQFDHAVPVACGGQSTVENLRLRCQAHNRYEAEKAFGKDAMRDKIARARAAAAGRREAKQAREAERARRAEEAREAAKARKESEARAAAAATEAARQRDIMPALRNLGVRFDDARRTAALTDKALPGASMEERVRYAIRLLAPARARKVAPVSCSSA